MGDGNSVGARVALILLSGLPGAGKTTFARLLGERLELAHIESDAIRRGLAAVPTYSPRESGQVFARVEAEARKALGRGRHALIDATNLTTRDRRRFVRLANELDARLVAVRLTAPEAVIRERLGRPRDGHSQADIAVYEQMKRRPQPFGEPVIVVDTSRGLEPAIALVLRLINATPGRNRPVRGQLPP
jgi:predicted kinase